MRTRAHGSGGGPGASGAMPSKSVTRRAPGWLVDQLDARHGRVVAGAWAELQDARVPAGAALVAGADDVEELPGLFFVADERDDLALVVHARLGVDHRVLRLGDHLLGDGAQRLGLGLRGDD